MRGIRGQGPPGHRMRPPSRGKTPQAAQGVPYNNTMSYRSAARIFCLSINRLAVSFASWVALPTQLVTHRRCDAMEPKDPRWKTTCIFDSHRSWPHVEYVDSVVEDRLASTAHLSKRSHLDRSVQPRQADSVEA